MVDQPVQLIKEVSVKEERCRIPLKKNPNLKTEVFRTPLVKANLILKWDSEGGKFMGPAERQKWLAKVGCPLNSFRKLLKDRNK